jgi:hypothetical protein
MTQISIGLMLRSRALSAGERVSDAMARRLEAWGRPHPSRRALRALLRMRSGAALWYRA